MVVVSVGSGNAVVACSIGKGHIDGLCFASWVDASVQWLTLALLTGVGLSGSSPCLLARNRGVSNHSGIQRFTRSINVADYRKYTNVRLIVLEFAR